jgi:hypothetical protein
MTTRWNEKAADFVNGVMSDFAHVEWDVYQLTESADVMAMLESTPASTLRERPLECECAHTYSTDDVDWSGNPGQSPDIESDSYRPYFGTTEPDMYDTPYFTDQNGQEYTEQEFYARWDTMREQFGLDS